MQISDTTAAARVQIRGSSPGARAPRVSTNRPAAALGSATPVDPPPKTFVERMEDGAHRARRRVDSVIDHGSLTARQAQALEEVERRFDRMMKRLGGAVEDGGAARDGIHRGLDIVYGELREALSDILANGRQATSAHARRFEPAGGDAALGLAGMIVDQRA